MQRSHSSLVVLVLAAVCVGIAPPATAKPDSTIVYQSVTSGQMNSFFEWNPRGWPVIGQTVSISRPVVVKAIRLYPDEVDRFKKVEYFERNNRGEYDQSWVENRRTGRVPVRTTVEIWRYLGDGPIPGGFDVTENFESVYKGTSSKPIAIGKPFIVPVGGGVELEPGRYFVTLGMQTDDPRMIAVRFVGQQNGKNTLGGYNHDFPNPKCRYKPTRDSTPGDLVYKQDSRSSPSIGPEVATRDFGTLFMTATTKVTECAVRGEYSPDQMVWNPGDLKLELVGRKA